MKEERNQFKTGVVLNYINLIVGNLIPIFYTPIMLELLGQKEYGLFKLSSNVTSYLSLVSLGIGSAVVRYLVKAKIEGGKEAEEKIFGLFMVIFRIISIMSFIIGTLLILSLDIWYGHSLTIGELERMKIIVFLLVCNTSLSFSISPYISVVNAHERFVFMQWMNIISTCLGPVLNLVVLFLGYKSIGMAVSSLAIGVGIRLAYLLYVRRMLELKPRYKNMPTSILKEIMIFSFWIFVGNVVGQLYNATDTVLIGAVPKLATVGVAVYNVGLTFNSIMLSLTTAISNLLAPKINKMVFNGATGADLTDLAIRIGRLQCYIMSLIVMGFIAFGRPFIEFYAGETYTDAYWVAVLMMVPNMIPLAQSVFSSIIVAQNKHRFRSIMYLVIAIINVIGTWLLMKPFGIIGAALMTGLALILGQGFIMNWFYKYKCDLEIRKFWENVGVTCLIPSILCSLTLVVSRYINFYNPFCFAVGIVVFIFGDIVLNWIFVMNDYEKTLMKEPIKRIF